MKGMEGFDFNKVMKAAQDMQKQMARVKDDLKERVVEGNAGGGMVVATVNGQQDIVAIKLDREVVNPEDVGMLEDLIVAAVNQAMKKSREMAEKEMGKITGGVLPPGLGI
ncbi:MAG: YbaB/EbfC family nucleoid-associated protein [Planctomycetota bacterium]|nr:YbaB/EbfC family nucleoid-associated protein [Planctomycetota bacterium]